MSDLKSQYETRFPILSEIAKAIQQDLSDHLKGIDRIDRISSRAKSIDRFVNKAIKEENGSAKYSDPINQIQDQIGARITCFYLSDVTSISDEILRYYTAIEKKKLIPESTSEFGYVGEHFILNIPTDVIPDGIDRDLIPDFFELQVKTLFQHAWSEASHDLAYKPDKVLEADHKRRVAFTAAQAWGADMIFEELFDELNS